MIDIIREAFADVEPRELVRDFAAAVALFSIFGGILFLAWGFGA